MKPGADNTRPPSPEAVRTVNQVCDRFDAAWKQAAHAGPPGVREGSLRGRRRGPPDDECR